MGMGQDLPLDVMASTGEMGYYTLDTDVKLKGFSIARLIGFFFHIPGRPNCCCIRSLQLNCCLCYFREELKKTYKKKHPNNKSISVVGKTGNGKWISLSEVEKALIAFIPVPPYSLGIQYLVDVEKWLQ